MNRSCSVLALPTHISMITCRMAIVLFPFQISHGRHISNTADGGMLILGFKRISQFSVYNFFFFFSFSHNGLRPLLSLLRFPVLSMFIFHSLDRLTAGEGGYTEATYRILHFRNVQKRI